MKRQTRVIWQVGSQESLLLAMAGRQNGSFQPALLLVEVTWDLSVQFSRSVVCNSFQLHKSQHSRPPCPSPTPGFYSNWCPSSRWCHPAISCLSSPSPPALNPSQHQGLFQWVNSAWGGRSTGVTASASVLPMNSQDWSPLGWTGWISVQFKGLSKVFSNTTV